MNADKPEKNIGSESSDENVSSRKFEASIISFNEKLYLNANGADIHFAFKSSDERIPAHKIILSAISPVFQTAFFGSMPVDDKIKIEDDGINGNAFKQFLQFF